MNNKKIIITGANGFIGEHLVKHFSAIGYHIIALVRSLPQYKVTSVDYVLYDMNDSVKEEVFNNADALIHCAYVRYDKNKNADLINLKGTHYLINECEKHGVKFVFLSSFSAHKNAVSHYGKMKLQCEQLIDISKNLIIKPGLVIGKKGLAADIMAKVKSSTFFPLVGAGVQPLQTVCIHDVCVVIETLLVKNKTGMYLVAESKPVSMKQFYKTIAKALNKKIIFIPIPFSLVYFASKLAELFKIKFPVSSDSVLGLKQLTTFDTSNDIASIGISLKTYDKSILLALN
ncbi:MAG: NAD-dependent epimerase/dehydratase family protein [Bacteroidia bacterium]|nr:NAD-dependent epimerase/dehydratase family protein [Bacteroidia bacterium]